MFVRNERSVKEFIQLYPVVTVIVIINFVLWGIYQVLGLKIGFDIYNWGLGHNPSVTAGEYHRLITPIFLHADLAHVAFNSFATILFAPALELMIGKFKFILFYLATGIIGNVGTYIINPSSEVAHLGASGAIYGLFGIFIFMVYLRKRLIDPGSAQMITVIFVIGLALSFIQTNINIAAHIFGFIGGFALAPIFLAKAEPYSIAMVKQRSRHNDDSETSFNPNRWKKKRKAPSTNGRGKDIFWFIFIVLVMIGFIAKFIVN